MEFDRVKKIIYTGIAAGILGLLLFLGYRFLYPGTEAPPPAPGERITGRLPGLPGTGELGGEPQLTELAPGESVEITPEQKLFRITDFPVTSPSLNKQEDKILYYKKSGGDLLSSDLDGKNQTKISNITVVGLLEAIWASTRDRAAVFYLDNETVKGFLHIGTSSVAVLPQGIKSFSWSPDGKSLAYLLPKNDRLDLITADASGRNSKKVFTTPIGDASINWVSADRIVFSTAPSGLAEGYLYVYLRSSGVFNKIVGPLFGLSTLWSADGSRLLLGATNALGKRLDLAVRDSSGKELSLAGSRTLPQKCVWQGTAAFYCAVPRAISAETVWPDDYLRGELNTSDRLLFTDYAKKENKEILNTGDFDMSDMLLNKTANWLVFVNRIDGSLWSLKIRPD